jgi:hypothetical protein
MVLHNEFAVTDPLECYRTMVLLHHLSLQNWMFTNGDGRSEEVTGVRLAASGPDEDSPTNTIVIDRPSTEDLQIARVKWFMIRQYLHYAYENKPLGRYFPARTDTLDDGPQEDSPASVSEGTLNTGQGLLGEADAGYCFSQVGVSAPVASSQSAE